MARTVRFGAFDADLKTGELRKDGRVVILQPQLLKVLSLLLERAGDLVTRDELRRRLWGDEVYVDYEHSLNKAVTKLRRTLGDAADKPRYIETLERRGYRFVAAVEGASGAPPSGAMLRLVVAGNTVPLSDGTHVIGRHPAAAVCIDSSDVSRRHALLTVRSHVATIADLNSRNGTFLNGKRVTGSTVLRDGDQIRLGATVVVFESGDVCPPTEAIRSE